jgi:GNAT superfamily N-acetyltransferase
MHPKQRIDFTPQYRSLTPENWEDFENLFGPKGACAGCWCMWWRLKSSEFNKQKGVQNKQAMKEVVDSGEIPGIIAYYKDQPIAWCSSAPRENFSLLNRSRILKAIDDEPVWSVVCLFIKKEYRRKGVSSNLLKAAIKYARDRGAKIVEGYPIDTKTNKYPDVFAATGLYSIFIDIGFEECARRSETRPIMRLFI